MQNRYYLLHTQIMKTELNNTWEVLQSVWHPERTQQMLKAMN